METRNLPNAELKTLVIKMLKAFRRKVDEFSEKFNKEIKSIEMNIEGPAQVAQLVRASCPFAKVAGSIPGQCTYKKQLMNP